MLIALKTAVQLIGNAKALLFCLCRVKVTSSFKQRILPLIREEDNFNLCQKTLPESTSKSSTEQRKELRVLYQKHSQDIIQLKKVKKYNTQSSCMHGHSLCSIISKGSRKVATSLNQLEVGNKRLVDLGYSERLLHKSRISTFSLTLPRSIKFSYC